jgi:penicillin-binding protein 2
MYLSRRHIIQIVFVLAAATFIIKLFFIQVVNTEYRIAAEKNIVQRIEEYPYRGIIYDRNKKLLVYNNPVYDLMVIPKAVKNLDTSSFCRTFNISPLEFTNALNKAKRYSHIRPSIFLKNIDHDELARIHSKLPDYLGFYVRARTVRKYPQAILANTLGYVGEISTAQLLADTLQYYKQGDLIGISGLEAKYETLLRGKRGIKYKITDARGQEKGPFKEGTLDILPVPGQDLITTIDASLQLYGEILMKNKIGSIVAIEPSTGEILTMVSSPSYDPNLLTSKNLSSNFAALEKDNLAPLFHRPIMAMYPPGSIFKLVQALIALHQGVVQAGTIYACNKKIVNCHPHPSPTNLHQAIQHSCNPYFYHVFKNIINQHVVKDTYEDTRIGLNKWLGYVRQFGLGKQLGIDLPHEKSGYLPDVNFYDARYGEKRWKASTIRSLDIGQGEMLVTPLQMANLAAIIANRGQYYTPHIIKAIEGQATFIEKHIIQIENKHFDFVINAMRDVIESSTGWRSRLKNIVVCGKTGTVENPHGEDHAVFMGFAPLEAPKIAIAVYVENAGWGARAAAAIAGLVLEKYLTGQVTRKSIEDYVLKGDFTH